MLTMEKNIFLICLLLLSQKSFSQQSTDGLKNTDSIKLKNDREVGFTKVETEAEFPGGQKKWIRYIEKNIDINTPDKNGAPKGVYTIIAKFIVSKDGSVTSVSAVTHYGYGMEEE